MEPQNIDPKNLKAIQDSFDTLLLSQEHMGKHIEDFITTEVEKAEEAAIKTYAGLIKEELTSKIDHMFQTFAKDTIKEALSSFEIMCETMLDSKQSLLVKDLEKKIEQSINKSADALWRHMEKELTSLILRILKEALSSSLPDFEISFKNMFESWLDGKQSHVVQELKQRAITMLTDGRHLATELEKSHRNLLDLAENVGASESNSFVALIEKVVVTKQAWIYEDFFSWALLNRDVTRLMWLCSQVDLPRLLAMDPVPLSQNTLLSILDVLASEI